MRIDLTVRACDRCMDIAVRASGPVRLDAVRPQLDQAAGVPTDAAIWHGDHLLGDDAVLGVDVRAGAVLDLGAPRGRRSPAGALALHQVGGPDAGRVVPLARGRLTIGRDEQCDIVLADADASRRHALVEIGGAAITVRDLGSTNGTTVDGETVDADGRPVAPGQLIRCGDSTFTVASPGDTPATVSDHGDGVLGVLRPPRRVLRAGEPEIVVPARTSATRPRGVQWVAALVPAAAGGAIAWSTHSAQFLLFALLSPVMMFSTAVGDRLHWRRSRRSDAALYRRRQAATQAQIAAALDAETGVRRAAAPDPAAVERVVALPATRLWERQRRDPDFLSVRLGTTDIPSAARRRDGSTVTSAGTVATVPASVGLQAGPVGIVAPSVVLDGVARWLVGQLAALHSPADLELVLLAATSDRWDWCRWLPHVRGRVATSTPDWPALIAELGAGMERRLSARRLEADRWVGRWQVLIVDRTGCRDDAAGLAAVLGRGGAAGITAICLDEVASALPTACHSIARTTGVTGSRAVVETGGAVTARAVVLDSVGPDWAERVSRQLAPLVDVGADDSAIPNSCTLLDVLALDDSAVSRIDRRWAVSDGGAGTAIGIAADGVLSVDLVADGPHALIAGTTGAGKSELLRTLVAGLAATHPADLVNFLLIDYKGGAAFAQCAQLPHTAGVVTDLDPFLTARALRSLHSELHRRERLFAAVGAADLDAYRATTPAEPVARLIIVVDEFAALSEELPDFVRGLVGVAQRGRSLGVHLVLATQRPGSAVTPEIRANTSLRIGLRVTDPGDSTDILDSPDAAFLDRANPGRGYLRAGSALVAFQAAHASSTECALDAPTVEMLGAWRCPAGTARPVSKSSDLARLVDSIQQAHRASGRRAARAPWLPALPDRIERAQLDRYSPQAGDDPARVAYAVADLPDEQRRAAMILDLRAGTSLLIAGAARSGRTELLCSLALGAATGLDPDQLHLYVLDAAGPLGAALDPLPHCATVLGPADLALAPTLMRRVDQRCNDDSARGRDAPLGLLLIDGWDVATAAMSDADALDSVELLTRIVRHGPSVGLSTVLVGGRGCLAPRLAAHFETRIALRLADPNDYAMAGIPPRAVPTHLGPGRGVRSADGAVVQLISATRAAGPAALAAAVAAIGQDAQDAGYDPTVRRASAVRLRSLPTRVCADDLPTPAACRATMLGIGGDDARPIAVDLTQGDRRFLVAGPPRSGRTTVLVSVLRQAMLSGLRVAVAAPARSALASSCSEYAGRVSLIAPTADVTDLPELLGDAAMVLVDDCEAFADTATGDALVTAMQAAQGEKTLVVAGRNDDLATTYRGLGAYARRGNRGLLLRPGPIDGELLGARLPRRPSSGPPGRGVAIGDPSLGADFEDGQPLPIQVALPPAEVDQPMCGYR